MKVRNGFVSNSSSSSFILAFPLVPANAEEVHDILFGNIKNINMYDYNASTKKMAKIIFADIQKGFASTEEICEEVCSGWYDGHPEYSYAELDKFRYESKEYREFNNKYGEECNKKGNKLANDFIKANKKSSLFIVEYSNNDGQLYCVMEHGRIFSSIPHLRISHH